MIQSKTKEDMKVIDKHTHHPVNSERTAEAKFAVLAQAAAALRVKHKMK